MAIGVRSEMIADKEKHSSYPEIVQCTFQYVSIIDTIRSLFLREDVLQAYQSYNSETNHTCESGEFSRFCCGSAFKTNELFRKHPKSLQIRIATDEFENCNALGSKATLHKTGGIYFVIQNMPRLSYLKNIYLISLYNGNDIKTKQTDFNNLWKIIVKEIKYLEEVGIAVNDNFNVKGTLIYVSFDNLGANQSLGLAEGFGANFYCRHCLCSKEECQTMCLENERMKRSKESYAEHLALIETSTNVDLTQTRGVKRYCALNDLKYFHILDNQSVDIMHDLNEGVIPFTLKHLVKYCSSEKIIKEVDLTKMIQYHDYGILNRKNVPSRINLDKHNLNQSASQSLCLLRHIPFILYEFREKLKDVWVCVENLLEIVQIAYSLKIVEHDLQNLNQNTFEYLSCVQQKLKITDNLTPKHHFMTHYASIIRAMGPLKPMSMIRFESKHKTFKTFMKNTVNFININKSMAIKHQQMMSRCENSYENQISSGKKTILKNIGDLRATTEISGSDSIYSVKWLQYNSYKFRVGLLIYTRIIYMKLRN